MSSLNAIAAQDIKRRGISAVDALLAKGPVHVIRNNRPRYVVMSEEDYARLTPATVPSPPVSSGEHPIAAAEPGIWEFLTGPRPWKGTRTKEDIDAQIAEERADWGGVPDDKT